MNTYPLARVSSKEHIEELRAGQLFLRNLFYYQTKEKDDKARSDQYDGSVRFPDSGVLSAIFHNNVENARITKITAHVACFYHFHCEKKGCFYVPEEDKQDLRRFNRDTAIIIDTDEFVRRIEFACEKLGLPLMHRDVVYLNSVQEQTVINSIKSGFIPSYVQNPQFVKNERFSHQHEYRVAIDYTPGDLRELFSREAFSLKNGAIIDSIRESKLTVNIGSIEDISEVFTLEEFLSDYYKVDR